MKMNVFFILFLLSLGCDKNSGGSSGPIATPSNISIEDVSVIEGNSGNTNLDVSVRLEHAHPLKWYRSAIIPPTAKQKAGKTLQQ